MENRIYFDDRYISVRDTSQNPGPGIPQLYCGQSGPDDLLHFIESFDQNPSVENACIISPSFDLFLLKIKECMPVIHAAGGLVRNHGGDVLMILRNNRWDLPKGKSEPGETPAMTAIREVSEECGIKKIKITGELPSSFHTYRLNGKLVLKRTYWFNMLFSGNEIPQPQVNEGISETRWVMKDQMTFMTKMVWPSLRELFKGEMNKKLDHA
jgi:8-oxo-dGTP pyrophosphatase MutT (NUDIX family)